MKCDQGLPYRHDSGIEIAVTLDIYSHVVDESDERAGGVLTRTLMSRGPAQAAES